MIVTYPNVPEVEGRLAIPRPAIYLTGSYDHNWHHNAAQRIERHVGAVLYGAAASGDSDARRYLQWSRWALWSADIVMFWIDSRLWAEFELGLLLGDGRSVPVVAGVAQRLSMQRDVVLHLLQLYGRSGTVYGDLDTTLHAASQWASRKA